MTPRTTGSLDGVARPGEAPALTLEHLHLAEVAPHVWRVSDGRLPFADPLRVLAVVEVDDERIEVVQPGDGLRCERFGSMREALEHVVRTTPAVTAERLGGTRR